jgi:predicted permease
MIRSSGFTSMVVATIALAVGVSLGVFSVTQSLLNHSLGVPNAEQILYYTLGSGDHGHFFSGPGYEALRANAAMRDVLAWKRSQLRMKTQDSVVKLSGALVTGNTFSVFRLKPSLGGFFSENEDAPDGGRNGWSAVLGYSCWKTRFGASHNVIGRVITVEGVPVHIVGVLPPEFTGVSPQYSVEILLPRHFISVISPGEDRLANPGYFEWMVFGRLPNGTTIQVVQANLNAIETSFRQSADPGGAMFASPLFSSTAPGSLLNVRDGRLGAMLGMKALRFPLLAMKSLAFFVFLFCCCNLVLLFLGRAKREASSRVIRMSLGARVGSEVRLAAAEAVFLAAIGCMVAVPIVWLLMIVLSRIIQSVPGFRGFPTTSPSPFLLVSSMLAILTLALMASAAATIFQGSRNAGLNLRPGGNATASRSPNWIIGVEVFASILLVTIAVVDGFGFMKLVNQPSGFASGDAVVASLDLEGNASNSAADPSIKVKRLIEQIEQSPGVQSVGEINVLPLSGSESRGALSVRGENGELRKQEIWPADVSVRYFSSVGTRIARGRGFVESDLAGDTVCVLSTRAASLWFSGRNPIGAYLYDSVDENPSNQAAEPYCRVIGVAEDAHLKSVSDPAEIAVYRLSKAGSPNIVVRAATSGLAMEAVRNAIQAVTPGSLTTGIDTIQAHIDDDLRVWRVVMLSGTLCALLAAIIMGVGMFGILSLQVAERRREIGIEIALGANRIQVCASVVRRLWRAVIIGLVLGTGTALPAAARLAEVYGLSIQFVVEGYLGSLAVLGVLLAASASIPLRRALIVSPMECLSSE